MEQRDYYWKRSETYQKWLLEKVLVDDDKVFTIMVLPIGSGEPNYRDGAPASGFQAPHEPRPPLNVPIGPFAPLSGYDSLNISPITEAPEVTAVGSYTPIILLCFSSSLTLHSSGPDHVRVHCDQKRRVISNRRLSYWAPRFVFAPNQNGEYANIPRIRSCPDRSSLLRDGGCWNSNASQDWSLCLLMVTSDTNWHDKIV